jgi:hypothetical protein
VGLAPHESAAAGAVAPTISVYLGKSGGSSVQQMLAGALE